MQQIDYQINNKFRIYIHKTQVRLMQNVLAFYLKCTCVSSQTHLRFSSNVLAFSQGKNPGLKKG